MMPPTPLPFPLWGPTLYAELSAGLWRALAAPWLAPALPSRPAVPARPPAAPGDTGSVTPGGTLAREIGRSETPAGAPPQHPAAAPARGQVILVPRARWQRRGRPNS
jgi:hypothetical protein